GHERKRAERVGTAPREQACSDDLRGDLAHVAGLVVAAVEEGEGEEAADDEDHEAGGDETEILVDEALDRGAEQAEQDADDHEADRAGNDARQDEADQAHADEADRKSTR